MIRQFRYGGAERQLIDLLAGINKRIFDVSVISFYDWGELVSEIGDVAGIRHISLHKSGRWDIVPFTNRLLRAIRQIRPRIIHGYMGPANLMALLGGHIFGAKIVWGVRASNMDLRRYDWLPRVIFQAERLASQGADLILVNSFAGLQYHIEHGFPAERMRVIHNGIDTARFKPHHAGRKRVRKEWGVKADQLVIGLAGRLDPMKNHALFVRAAALLCEQRGDVVFVCVGEGPNEYREQLLQMTDELGVSANFRWTGYRADMVDIYNAFDIAASTSGYGEGLSNAIAEAMACGVPCVVTATGDAALLVGDSGLVVRSAHPEAFAAACATMAERIQIERELLSQAARQRITESFGLRQMIGRTEEELLSLAAQR